MSDGKRIYYGKLVRDRIPEIIEADGKVARIRVLTDPEVMPALLAKLGEEAEELRVAGHGDRLGELADLREVLSALTGALGFSDDQVDQAADLKRRTRGGFNQRLWLEEVWAEPVVSGKDAM